MDKRRGGEIIFFIGHNSTGKTVVATELVKMFNERRSKQSSNRPINYGRLAVYDVQNRFTDLMKPNDISIRTSNKDWCKELLTLRDSMVVLDDYKVLVPNDRMDSSLLDLLQYRAELGIDIILITHNPSLVLERLSYYVDKYFLFYTLGNDDSFKKKVMGAEKLIALRKVINQQYKKYTAQQYSNLYPNFPFIYYDLKTEVAKKINFK